MERDEKLLPYANVKGRLGHAGMREDVGVQGEKIWHNRMGLGWTDTRYMGMG